MYSIFPVQGTFLYTGHILSLNQVSITSDNDIDIIRVEDGKLLDRTSIKYLEFILDKLAH